MFRGPGRQEPNLRGDVVWTVCRRHRKWPVLGGLFLHQTVIVDKYHKSRWSRTNGGGPWTTWFCLWLSVNHLRDLSEPFKHPKIIKPYSNFVVLHIIVWVCLLLGTQKRGWCSIWLPFKTTKTRGNLKKDSPISASNRKVKFKLPENRRI